MSIDYLAGAYYGDEGFRRGYVAVEEGVVVETGSSPPGEPVSRGVIIPALCNCHTHAGDAYIRPPAGMGLDELVGWPGGLKHRLHRETPGVKKAGAVRGYVVSMARHGIAGFVDFREEGVKGAGLLAEAAAGLAPRPFILGRPAELPHLGAGGGGAGPDPGAMGWREEARELIGLSDGFGLSGMGDLPLDVMAELSRLAHSRDKHFAFHMSEGRREDIDAALELGPDHLVHMCFAEPPDLDRLADAGVPVAVCPSSNRRFGRACDVPAMLDRGITVVLGTDNAMFGPPDLLGEARMLYRGDAGGRLEAGKVLEVLFEGPPKLLRSAHRICVEPGFNGGVVVVKGPCDNPEKALLEPERTELEMFTPPAPQDAR